MRLKFVRMYLLRCVEMKKIIFCSMIIVVFGISSVTSLKFGKMFEFVDDLLPSAVSSFLSSQKEGLSNSVKEGVEAAKKLVNDKVIPISQLPLYTYRAENKIYTLSDLKRHGDEFKGASIQPGNYMQKLAEKYGFFDMIDVKHVLCEFFYNAAEIEFYRGVDNFSKEILDEVEKLGVLKPEDIKTLEELGFKKKGQRLKTWYWSNKYEKFVPLMGDPIGAGNSGKGFKLLSKEKVAIKQSMIKCITEYYKLTDDIATLVWHLFFTYQDELAPRENIVHRHLKREQIQGHLLGNSFVFSMLNDTVKFHKVRDIYLGSDPLDTSKLKKEIKSFVKKLGKIYTSGPIDPFKEQTFIQKVVQYILGKLGIIKVYSDVDVMYKFKLEVLFILTEVLERDDLNEEKAKQIIELCMNHWKIVFYLHVSGTMTSTKPAPEFYNYHETEEKVDSALTSDSDTEENENEKASSFGSFETTDTDDPDSPRNRIMLQNADGSEIADDKDISEFGNRVLEEKDVIVKKMEDKNPFRDLLRNCLKKVDLNMKYIREELIRTFQTICQYLLLEEEDCAFINRSIRNINTYKLKKDGRIASRKYCNEHKNDCRKIEPKHYMMFLRKMTEIQGVSMGIVEYMILLCEKNQTLKILSKKQKSQLRHDLKDLFKDNYYLRIFVSKEYQKALTDYAKGKADSNIAKLAIERAEQIHKGIGLMPKKPPDMDPHDMDDYLIPDNS